MRYLLIGRGKMGTLIRETAASRRRRDRGRLFGRDDLDRLGQLGKVADVVIDFSRPEALPESRLLRPPHGHGRSSPAPPATRRTELRRSSGVPGHRRAGAVERQLLPGGGGAGFRALRVVAPVLRAGLRHRGHRDPPQPEGGRPQRHRQAAAGGRGPPALPSGRCTAGRAAAAAGRRTRSASTPFGAAPWRGPTPSTSSAPTRSWSSPTGPPAAGSSSAAPCTWPGCCREKPSGVYDLQNLLFGE